MKSKLDIRGELVRRKYKTPGFIPSFLYYTVGKTKLLGGKYHPHYEIIDKLPKKGPVIVIWNHQSRRDHTFICRAIWPRRMNMVCEYNEFFRSHLHWAFKHNQIIPKKPFDKSDYVGIRAIDSILKSGGVVALSPEGNSSNFGNNQPVALGTGRFLKHYHVPIYMVRINGSYLTNNKNFDEDRFGKVEVKLYSLFTSEDLLNLSEEEIERKINEELRFDDYKWNKTARVAFKHKSSITTHLEDMCYKCPTCGEEFQMVTENNKIYCSKCGAGAEMDDYYDFHPFENSIIPESPLDWITLERKAVIDAIRKDKNYSYQVDVKLGFLPNDHYLKDYALSEPVGYGKIIIDHQGFRFIGFRDIKPYCFNIDYKDIYTFNISIDFSHTAVYHNGEYHDFTAEKPGYLTKALLVLEEMHRLHVNDWKNFPWFDDLYK